MHCWFWYFGPLCTYKANSPIATCFSAGRDIWAMTLPSFTSFLIILSHNKNKNKTNSQKVKEGNILTPPYVHKNIIVNHLNSSFYLLPVLFFFQVNPQSYEQNMKIIHLYTLFLAAAFPLSPPPVPVSSPVVLKVKV